MNEFVKGYDDDAGEDIVLDDYLDIKPGFSKIILPAQYTPAKGEVAFLVARGSTANVGIFPIAVAIDTGYEGQLTAWIVNTSERTVFKPGERAFAVVNLKLAPSRGKNVKVARPGQQRGSNKEASSGQ